MDVERISPEELSDLKAGVKEKYGLKPSLFDRIFKTQEQPKNTLSPYFINPPPTKEIRVLDQLLHEAEGWQGRDPEMFKQHLLLLSQQATKYAEEIEKK